MPTAENLRDVGPSQLRTQFAGSTGEQAIASKSHKTFLKRVRKGTVAMLEGHRALLIPTESKDDLMSCVELMESPLPLKFHWNTGLYTHPGPMKAPRVQSDIRHLQGDNAVDDVSTDEDDDANVPKWQVRQVYLISTECAPWWAIAR